MSGYYVFNPFTKKMDWTEAGTAGSTIDLANNLKPLVSTSVNVLEINTKSGGEVPDSVNFFTISIPDGSGYTNRTRKAQYLSGDSKITLADAANYWSKGSLDAEIKTAWLYAIWDGTGIVWALAGYSGFTMVPTTTTATDDDYFLLETNSTYTRDNAHYCVAVAKIRYQYDTADTPDHTIQATVENAPQVIWNPKSDYGYQKRLATTVAQASDIAAYSTISVVVKQSGKYLIVAHATGNGGLTLTIVQTFIKTGSATYGSAVQKAQGYQRGGAAFSETPPVGAMLYLNIGDTIHLGVDVSGSGGDTRSLYGDDTAVGLTSMFFLRID